jgi:hypothetical protein
MSPKLLILNGKRRGDVVELAEFSDSPQIDIGNRKSAKLTVRDPWVSYNHATITRDGERFVIEDQNSSNGTWVEGQRVDRHELTPDTVFALGHTKVKFVVGEVPQDEVFEPDDLDGDGVPDGEQSPWWDRVLEDGSKPQQLDGQALRRLHRLEDQLEEERRMRQALERFLDLPAGTTAGEAARAGELEEELKKARRQLEKYQASDEGSQVQEIVAQQTERMRRDQMSRMVELEDQAARAQAKVVELEGRLQAKTEQVKSDIERTREKLQAEIERLTGELEAARKAASESEAVKAERAIANGLRDELGERDATIEDLESQRSELKVDLEAARSEVKQWKQEHAKIVQEIDEISMEQIEVEDEFNTRIRDLEERLRERGVEVPAEAAPERESADSSVLQRLTSKPKPKPKLEPKPEPEAAPAPAPEPEPEPEPEPNAAEEFSLDDDA